MESTFQRAKSDPGTEPPFIIQFFSCQMGIHNTFFQGTRSTHLTVENQGHALQKEKEGSRLQHMLSYFFVECLYALARRVLGMGFQEGKNGGPTVGIPMNSQRGKIALRILKGCSS